MLSELHDLIASERCELVDNKHFFTHFILFFFCVKSTKIKDGTTKKSE